MLQFHIMFCKFLQEEDILIELSRKAAAGRVLLLLDGLDEVHGVGTLDRITLPAGKKFWRENLKISFFSGFSVPS